MISKPMLAASMEIKKGKVTIPMTFTDLAYPLAASDKLDGIRCERVDDKTLSRSFKPIPNKYIQSKMEILQHNGLDGEIITYHEDGTQKEFNDIQSDVMSEDGEPDFKFAIFDYVKDDINKPYMQRINDLMLLWQDGELPDWCFLVLPTIINNEQDLLVYEVQALARGQEGIMTRKPDGPYKCGRSTFKEQYLIKIKRFKDSEAVITGFEEKMHNENEATKDAFGRTKRSSHKDNLVPAGTLGILLATDVHTGDAIRVGTFKGLKDADKQHIWDNQSQYVGRIFNYRYQEIGMKDLPRIPSFRGFRDKRDM